MRATRAHQTQNAPLPLADVRLGEPLVTVGMSADTAAWASVRVQERRRGRLAYAPLEFVFTEVAGAWQVAAARGVLLGLCGLAQG
jgi:hypothetical protein